MHEIPQEINKQVEVPAGIEAVYDAWVKPEVLLAWFRSGAGQASAVNIDDEGFEIKIDIEGKPHRIHGRYLERQRPDKLSFTWNASFSTHPETTVHITLESLAADRTRLNLHHVGFVNAEAPKGFAMGWAGKLDYLQKNAARILH